MSRVYTVRDCRPATNEIVGFVQQGSNAVACR